MKTNYHPRNRSRHNYGKNISILVAVFIFAAILLTIFDGLFMRLAAPLWQGENALAVSLRNTGQFFRSKDSLIQENNELKERLIAYNNLLVSARALKDKDDVLLATFGREGLQDGIAATVLMHPPESAYDVLVIDAGSNAGVLVGDKVNTPEGYSIGIVAEVFGNSSRVRLFTSTGEKTNAVLERGQLAVIIVGMGGGNFKLILPRDLDIEVGDRILSPSINSQMVAVVGDISLKPTDSFKEVIARSPINIHNQRFVIVRHE